MIARFFKSPLEITPAQAAEALQTAGQWRLVDCREEHEHALCRIEGAQLLPLSRWGELAADAFAASEERILIYCHHGMRSLRAAKFLSERGFANVRSLTGGIDAWSRQVDPSVPRY
jgi:rhodanese-related sulfurtransferase